MHLVDAWRPLAIVLPAAIAVVTAGTQVEYYGLRDVCTYGGQSISCSVHMYVCSVVRGLYAHDARIQAGISVA